MGRGKSQKSLDLIAAAQKILAEIQPATVRAVCYRLFVAGIIDSMEKRNTSKVSVQLTWAREQGVIPWEWIVDESRHAERVMCWDDPEAFARSVSQQYRRDNWSDQDTHVEVWSEKGTMRGTLMPVLIEYGVTFRVLHGFSSSTIAYDAAQRIEGELKEAGRAVVILYAGDWDPSGLFMSERDLPSRLRDYGAEPTRVSAGGVDGRRHPRSGVAILRRHRQTQGSPLSLVRRSVRSTLLGIGCPVSGSSCGTDLPMRFGMRSTRSSGIAAS